MRATAAILAIMLAACGNGGGSNCTAGTEGCECTPAGLCDPPNTCQGGVCVAPPADTGTDTPVDTVVDTATDDYVGEFECSSDGDCDDSVPCTVDSCDLDFNTCSHEPFDGDEDGFPAMEVEGTACGGTDCNDADPLTGEQECSVVNECCDGCKWTADCWYDETTGMIWQGTPPTDSMTWSEAITYCNTLTLAGIGAGEWLVPTIGELRTLVRGCPSIEDGGACGVTDSCLDSGCSVSCGMSSCPTPGPRADGCYVDPMVGGICNEGAWSNSEHATEPDSVWFISLDMSSIDWTPKESHVQVRCLHKP